MKPSFRVNRVWQIGYPLAVYFIVYNLAYKLFCVIFSKIGSPLFWLGISAAITIPLIYGMYKKLPTIKCEKRFQSETIFKELALVALIVAIGIGLNVCITQLSLVGESAGFEKALETLYSGGLFARIFSTCICILESKPSVSLKSIKPASIVIQHTDRSFFICGSKFHLHILIGSFRCGIIQLHFRKIL